MKHGVLEDYNAGVVREIDKISALHAFSRTE